MFDACYVRLLYWYTTVRRAVSRGTHSRAVWLGVDETPALSRYRCTRWMDYTHSVDHKICLLFFARVFFLALKMSSNISPQFLNVAILNADGFALGYLPIL